MEGRRDARRCPTGKPFAAGHDRSVPDAWIESVHVEPSLSAVRSLPDELGALAAACEREGYRFLERLGDDWREGRNRFDEPGERLVAARLDGALVGIGGIDVDPYAGDPGVGRLRHLYVSPEVRRRGIGRAVVLHLIDGAGGTFDTVRLRVADAAGARFYESLGFVAVDDTSASHVMTLSG